MSRIETLRRRIIPALLAGAVMASGAAAQTLPFQTNADESRSCELPEIIAVNVTATNPAYLDRVRQRCPE